MKRVKISQMNLNNLAFHIVDITAITDDELKVYAVECTTLINSLQIKRYIKQKFGEYSYYYYDDDENNDLTGSLLFAEEFSHFIRQMSVNTCMLMKGFTKNYDITENYFLNESGYQGTKSGEVESLTSYPNKTVATSTQFESTISGTTKEVSKSVTDLIQTSNSATIVHDKNVDFQGSTTENFANVSKVESSKHGNIGVQTPAEMLSKEYLIRFKSVLYDVIDSIMNSLTVCVELGD